VVEKFFILDENGRQKQSKCFHWLFLQISSKKDPQVFYEISINV